MTDSEWCSQQCGSVSHSNYFFTLFVTPGLVPAEVTAVVTLVDTGDVVVSLLSSSSLPVFIVSCEESARVEQLMLKKELSPSAVDEKKGHLI